MTVTGNTWECLKHKLRKVKNGACQKDREGKGEEWSLYLPTTDDSVPCNESLCLYCLIGMISMAVEWCMQAVFKTLNSSKLFSTSNNFSLKCKIITPIFYLWTIRAWKRDAYEQSYKIFSRGGEYAFFPDYS